MQKIKILQIVDSLNSGGMENIMVQVCNHLDLAKFSVTICCLSSSGPFAQRLRPEVSVVDLEKPPGFSLGTVRALRRLLKKENFDLIHTHHLGGLIYAALSRPILCRRRPRIVHSEHIILYKHELERRRIWQRKLLYPLTSCVFTVSEQQLEQLRELGLNHRNQFTLRNGVDCKKFHPVPPESKEALRRQLGLEPGAFWIGKVARFAPEKRHITLIEAFEIAVAEQPQLRLLLLGDRGSEKERVLSRIASSPARDKIHWAGMQQDPVPWYQALDALVIASSSEGMPNAALEGMACGLPLLSNDVCGISEVASDGEHGWVEDLGSVPNLSSALMRIAVAPSATLQNFGHASRQHIERHFSLDEMLETYRALYLGKAV